MAVNLSKKCLERLDDGQLVARIRVRDPAARQAFTVLIGRYRDSLLRRCQVRLGNRYDAEDALQETMLRAYRGLDRFRSEASVRTWLTAIADNQCASLAQRRARHVIGGHLRGLIELHEQARLQTHVSSEGPSRRVQRALARVPRRDREILRLRFFQGLALEEIANTLNIGLSAAKMRLYRALDRLQARLGDPCAASAA